MRAKYAAAIRLGIEYRRAQAGWPVSEGYDLNIRRIFVLGRRYYSLEYDGGRLYELASRGYQHWSALPPSIRGR